MSFGAIYSTVVKFENLDENEKSKTVDIHFTTFESNLPENNSTSIPMSNSLITLNTQVTNVSSGSNLAMRYYYKGECQDSCTKLIIKGLQIMKDHPAEMLFLTVDKRFLLDGMMKSNQPMVSLQVYQGGQLLQDLKVTLPT